MSIFGRLPTVILLVNYPFHKGAPNDKHGKFFLAGSIPGACYDVARGGSKFYDTEQDAIDAALAAGATHLQGVDCRKIKWGG